ncbi:hypothetical protein C6A77_05900 [Pseudomonas sp. AFG_SD02_1510_Pfu_092]|nr:hypothetical protein C6A77_05900 [Pseudomonas sp. AFG_SD02_1510_Pfu_092]
MGAGKPAKNATRCMAPATPVFAGAPAPTATGYRDLNQVCATTRRNTPRTKKPQSRGFIENMAEA